MIRLALVGAGDWGRNFVHTARNIPSAQIVVVCRRDARRRPDGLAENATVTSDLAAAAEDVEGAIIATPPASHAECAAPFIERSVPILLEKPVAETLEDAEAIFSSAEANKVAVLVDHVYLFAPAYLELREAVRSWNPLQITSRGGNHGPFRDYEPLLDWAPHDLAMAISILGADTRLVSARRLRAIPPGENYRLELRAGDSQARITIGNGMEEKVRRFEIRSGSRCAIYDDLEESKLIIDDEVVEVEEIPPLEVALRTFVQCIRTGRTDWRFDPQLSLKIMRILAEAAVS